MASNDWFFVITLVGSCPGLTPDQRMYIGKEVTKHYAFDSYNYAIGLERTRLNAKISDSRSYMNSLQEKLKSPEYEKSKASHGELLKAIKSGHYRLSDLKRELRNTEEFNTKVYKKYRKLLKTIKIVDKRIAKLEHKYNSIVWDDSHYHNSSDEFSIELRVPKTNAKFVVASVHQVAKFLSKIGVKIMRF